jgi:hypothetical protein
MIDARKKNKIVFFTICCIGSIAFLIIIYNVYKNRLTAKDYYYKILPDKQYASYVPYDAKQIERISRHFDFSNMSKDKLKQLLEQATPEKQLAPFINDIIRNTPSKYKPISDDIFAGVFPLGKLNSRVVSTPNGGYLILVNYELKKCLWEWAKLVVNVVFAQKEDPNFLPDASLETITNDFTKSIHEYLYSGTVPAFTEYAKDEKSIFVTVLWASSIRFILAHEYSHILLGHVDDIIPIDLLATYDDPNYMVLSPGYIKREFDADILGTEIHLIQSQDNFIELDSSMKALGVYYCLMIFDTLKLIDTEHSENKLYVQNDMRSTKLKQLLYQKYHFPNFDNFVEADFTKAIDYLLVQSIISDQNSSISQRNQKEKSSLSIKINKLTNKSVTENILPNSSNEVDITWRSSDFILFMRNFSERKKKEDWESMIRIVSNTPKYKEYYDNLLNHAIFTTCKGIKDQDVPWNSDESFKSNEFIELALTIITAGQNRRNIHEATLTNSERSKILFAWRELYANTLTIIGATGEPILTRIAFQEAMDKNLSSIKIAELLQDPVLTGFSCLVGAWAFERNGNAEKASALRDKLSIDVEWPLISKKSDGNYKIVYPKSDYRGNVIPESFENIK